MSYTTFASETNSVNLKGPERFHMAAMMSDNLLKQIGPTDLEAPWLRPFLPDYMSIIKPEGVAQIAATAIKMGMDHISVPGYHNTTSWTMIAAQTAQESGDDVLRLSARLHMQCEIHAWIDGPAREWVATLIEQGLRTGQFRSGMNWDGVIDLLRESADGPVITHASQAESFPNYDLANVRYETFEKWTEKKRWDVCVKKLRTQWGGCEITPDWWDEFYWKNAMSWATLKKVATA